MKMNKSTKSKTKPYKTSLIDSPGQFFSDTLQTTTGVSISSEALGAWFIPMIVILVVMLSVWIASLVRMRRFCPGSQPSAYWIVTLILFLVPSGLTQIAAFLMACVGLGSPKLGCVS